MFVEGFGFVEGLVLVFVPGSCFEFRVYGFAFRF